MGCRICGKKATKAAKCPACGYVAAHLCDGRVCQPSLWKTGPNEKPSSIRLMNFECERCGTKLEVEVLPAPFDTVFEPGKMFGFIGTYLLHGYGELVDGAGYEFAIAHFLNTMAPEAKEWSFLANATVNDPKTHGDRPLTLMGFAHSQAMAQRQDIDAAMRWVTSWLTGVMPSRLDAVPASFYTSAMVVNKAQAVCELVPDTSTIPRELRGQGNYSSRATKTQTDAVVAYMRDPKIQKKIGWPAFSVWDCNCFHNSGYIMGKYALDTAIASSETENPPVLIVNIDQHSDAGSTDQNIISSDRWGKALIECYPNSAYLSFGSGGKTTTHQIETHYRGVNGSVSSPKSMAIPKDNKFTNTHLQQLFSGSTAEKKEATDLIKAYWMFLLTKIYPKENTRPANFKFVYLTIDRDCMVGNLNQWGDAKSILTDYSQVATLADTILSTVVSTGARVVGFDVTGLPEDHLRLACNMSAGDTKPAFTVLRELREELAAFQDIWRRHIVTG